MTFINDLTRLRTRADFIRVLGVSEEALAHVLDFEPPPAMASGQAEPQLVEKGGVLVATVPPFFRHQIPKRNAARGFRVAWEPSYLMPQYKKLGTWLAAFFKHKLPGFPHPAAFGYLGGRNIRDNAAVHRGHKFLLAVDVESFFAAIDRASIRQLFISAGVNEEVSELLSRFLTIGGVLPLGLPTSPTISNAVFLPVDAELQTLAEAHACVYSRYSDDLNFSGDSGLPPIEAVEAVLARFGFRVAQGKTRRSRIGQAHFVTGLSVSDSNQPHVPKKKKRRLRQELYFAQKFGLDDHFQRKGINDPAVSQREINRIDGLVKFVAYHEPKLSGRLKPQWEAILKAAGERPSYTPRKQHLSGFYICIDEAEIRSPDGPLLALGLSVTQHAGRVAATTRAVQQAFLSDMYADGDIAVIEKRGVHYADATEDLKLRFVEAMQSMPFEGYVAFARLHSSADYEATYLRVLGAVIRRRLMAAESQFANVLIEKNNKVSEAKVQGVIFEAWTQLRAEKNRHPKATPVGFVSKPHPGVSVPDFLLGVLGKYLNSEAPKPKARVARDRLLFERIRDKYKLIIDVDTGAEYSRRRPIVSWAERTQPELAVS